MDPGGGSIEDGGRRSQEGSALSLQLPLIRATLLSPQQVILSAVDVLSSL